uniref:Lipoprotein n=1 Tax=Strongyloides venezuelensis TaxID=75913 RepID=A0A0K0FVW8_STRVS
MFYELLTFSCTVASIVLSIVKCSKENQTPTNGKTAATISKLKDDTPSVKKTNENKKTSDEKAIAEKEANNNQKSCASSTDNFKRPEDQNKFAKRKDPNYMTLNLVLDDCFEKTGETLPSSKNAKKSENSSKEAPKKTAAPEIALPQKPKNCGIAGSADPQYQTLNFFSDECFNEKK